MVWFSFFAIFLANFMVLASEITNCNTVSRQVLDQTRDLFHIISASHTTVKTDMCTLIVSIIVIEVKKNVFQ